MLIPFCVLSKTNVHSVKSYYYFGYFLLSVILVAALLPLGAYSFEVKSFAAFAGFMGLTYFVLSKYPGSKSGILLALLLPPGILYLIIHFLSFSDTLLALPSSVAHLIGILLGYWVYFSRQKLTVFITSLMLAAAGSYWGYDWWNVQCNYGFTARLATAGPIDDLVFTDEQNKRVSLPDKSGKIVVLEFWNTGCAACIKKFPEFQKLYDKWVQSDKFRFYSVNIPLDRDTSGQARALLQSRHYSFPLVFADKNEVLKRAGVSFVPTILVIDENARVIYRGGVDDLNVFLENISRKNMVLFDACYPRQKAKT